MVGWRNFQDLDGAWQEESSSKSGKQLDEFRSDRGAYAWFEHDGSISGSSSLIQDRALTMY